MIDEFRRIIIPGQLDINGVDFVFGSFTRIIVEFPKQFLNASSGYGRHYGLLYGRNF